MPVEAEQANYIGWKKEKQQYSAVMKEMSSMW